MQQVIHIQALPETALDAASAFASDWLPQIRDRLAAGNNSVIVLPQAASDHTGWRRAVARDLARACTPVRVNILSAGDAAAQAGALRYLDSAAGVTGQYLPLAKTE